MKTGISPIVLADAISLILEDRREDALRRIPPEAKQETISVSFERTDVCCRSLQVGYVNTRKFERTARARLSATKRSEVIIPAFGIPRLKGIEV